MTDTQLAEACMQISRFYLEFVRILEGKGGNLIKLLPNTIPENVLKEFYSKTRI